MFSQVTICKSWLFNNLIICIVKENTFKMSRQIFTKSYRDKSKYEWEKYALLQLEGTIASKLISFDDHKLIIEMSFIQVLNVDLMKICSQGDEAIYKYAEALYEVKKTLAEGGIAYYDWKREHISYDKNQNKITLIDYDEHETKIKPDIEHESINKKFEFVGKIKYINEHSFIIFKKYLEKIRYYV